jgi:hypothetical protein
MEPTSPQAISPQALYANLDQIDQADVTKSAEMRQQVQEVLADSQVSLSLRQDIADRLSQANHLLTQHTVTGGDSY